MTDQQLKALASSCVLAVSGQPSKRGTEIILTALRRVRAETLRKAAATARNHCGCGCCETLARKLAAQAGQNPLPKIVEGERTYTEKELAWGEAGLQAFEDDM